MKHIVKTLSLLSIMAVIPCAFAAPSRVGMVSKASPRLPSIAGYLSANYAKAKTTTTTSNTSYLADTDCINNYTDCIKSSDACGSGFEDCTNNILLHIQMPKCLNVLSQCTDTGRESLFGSKDMGAIATAATPDANGEVIAYTYPTASSVLGQMVTAAQIANSLASDQCVKKYTSCVKKDSVCGDDFELCTDNTEFKRQAVACNAVLARCQGAGKAELFGTTENANALNPMSNSRIGEMITEGKDLAVNNAVATCNKVTDQCILNACTKNPNKCIDDRPEVLIRVSDAINGGKAVTMQDLVEMGKTSKREVSAYLRQECKQTIGSNKYCYMTVKGSVPNKASVLTDPDNVDEVFDDMFNNRWTVLKGDKIQQIIDKFDTKAQDKCIETVTSCAMRACGGGIGSVCYKLARDDNGSVNIAQEKSYNEIKSACRAIADNDANCQYSAVLSNRDGLANNYMDEENDVFTTLFPSVNDQSSVKDPIGIVATLNATLSTSYNDAAIERMKKQCQTVALGCVKSMCGKDYINCYRNRTDIVAGTYDTEKAEFDRSMNKMGGILDYNIVIGLCMNTVKNASVCEEHLKVATADWRDSGYSDGTSWDDSSSVRNAWVGANTTKIKAGDEGITIACAIKPTNANDNCFAGDRAEPNVDGTCEGVMDDDGCIYDDPVKQNSAEYVLENAGKTLFQQLLADVEKEAQAKYNAKLTNEMNVCRNNNNGGIMGASDNGSTFMWVKLKNNKIPKDYAVKGLTSKQFSATGDLYGSFCRARITLTSDDKDIQEELSKSGESIAYFAVGDAFTCGSWLKQSTLNSITNKVAERARKDAGEGSTKEKIAYAWGTVAPALAGGVGGFALMDSLQQNGKSLGGLLNNSSKEQQDAIQDCISNVEKAEAELNKISTSGSNEQKMEKFERARGYANVAYRKARAAGVDVDDYNFDVFNGTWSDAVVGKTETKGTGKYQLNPIGVADVKRVIRDIKNAATDKFCGVSTACGAYITKVESDINPNGEYYNDSYANLAASIISNLEAAKSAAQKEAETAQNKGNDAEKESLKIIVNSLSAVSIPSSFNLHAVEITTSETVGATGAKSGDVERLKTSLRSLYEACQNNDKNTDTDDARKKRRNANLIAGAAGTAVLGALGAGITGSVLQAKYENAANDAVKQWYEEIGEHIQCYLGNEEVGSYGDVVTFDID